MDGVAMDVLDYNPVKYIDSQMWWKYQNWRVGFNTPIYASINRKTSDWFYTEIARVEMEDVFL